MATGSGNVEMMVSVLPGTMTGFASLNAGLASINNSFLNMTQAISDNFGLVDTAILTTGVVVAQFAADAMSAFADFEQSMKIVQLVSGQTADQIQYLGQKANEFAIQYRTDIDQITEGLQTLGRAGLNSATEQTEVLQNGLSTAKLEGRELNSVLQELIQNTALLGGDLKSDQFGEQSQYVNDLLVATSLSAPITTHDVSETLKYSGGIAAAAGANIESDEGKKILEDYMGAIAAFAQKGVTGSIAGTALRAFFNKPATQDSSVVDALSSIGLKPEYLWQDGGEKMKPVSEQIAIIKDQMDKLNISTMDQLQIWSKIVGGKMGQQMMKLESEDIKNLTSDIREAESANSLANESMNTFKMNINEIGQEGQKAFRDYGSTLVWIFNPIVEVLKEIVHLFNNPVITSALAVGTLGFFRAFISRARQVLGGFKQGLSNIWRDYTSGERFSIRQYRGDKTDESGAKYISPTTTHKASDYKTPKDFMSNWGMTAAQRDWKDFQEGKLTANQYGMLYKTQKWSASTFEKFPNVADSSIMRTLAKENMLSSYHYKAIQDGMHKTEFMNKYGAEIEALYVKYLKASQGLEANSAALEENIAAKNRDTAAEKEKAANDAETNTNSVQQNASANAKKTEQDVQANNERVLNNQQTTAQIVENTIMGNETLVTSQGNTTTSVVTSFNAMCNGIKSSVNSLYTNVIGQSVKPKPNLGKYPIYMPYGADVGTGSEKLGYHMYETPIGPKVAGIGHMAGYWGGALPYLPYQMYDAPLTNPKPVFIPNPSHGEQLKQDGFASPTSSSGQQHKVDTSTSMPPTLQAVLQQIQALETQIKIYKEQETADETLIKKLKEEEVALSRQSVALEQQEKQAKAQAQQDQLKQQGETARRRREANAQSNHQPSEHVGRGSYLTRQEINDIRKSAKESADAVKSLNKTQRYIEDSAKRNNTGVHSGYDRDVRDKGILERAQADKQLWLTNRQEWNRQHGVKTSESSVPSFYTYNQSAPSNLKSAAAAQAEAEKAAKSFKNKFSDFGKTARTNFMSYIDRDRTGRMLGFANKGLGKWTNRLLNATDVMGGPFMAAMMAVTLIMQYIQNLYQDYCKELSEAKNRVEEAHSTLEKAEDSLKESIKTSNPDLDADGINEVMYDTYAKMYDTMQDEFNNGLDTWRKKATAPTEQLPQYQYDEEADDGSLKLAEDTRSEEDKNNEELDKNTRALYRATAELNTAMDVYVAKATDSTWGIDGWTGEISDDPFGFASHIPGAGGIISQGLKQVSDFFDSDWTKDGTWKMTNSQKDENYAGNTEMVGLMLEDWKDANGDWIAGLRTMMGKSVNDFANIIPDSTKNFMSTLAQGARDMGSANNLRLQTSMKQDKKTWQALAKEIAKQERKTQKSVGKEKTGNKKIEGLIAKLQATTGGGFSRTQILQGAYLQQMQDMLAVAQQAIVPIISQNAQTAAQNLLQNANVNQNVTGTGSSTYGTQEAARAIAAMVAQIAMAKSAEATRNAALMIDPSKATEEEKQLYDLAQNTKNADEFLQKATRMSNGYDNALQAIWDGRWDVGIGQAFQEGWSIAQGAPIQPQNEKNRIGVDTRPIDAILKNYLATAKMTVFGWDPIKAKDFAEQQIASDRANGASTSDMYNTYAKNYMTDAFVGAIESAYLLSDMGEDDNSGSGGSGGSGGGDSGDDNKGTKKERVDLVLCNKKEIPKLNVNLFKKPPSFTVLNKNFKLRDIKVNTQDKPKAVLSSIKNAIIDVQKRSDPKIIQDESAEYDPVSATEGSSVPSGSTNTGTD